MKDQSKIIAALLVGAAAGAALGLLLAPNTGEGLRGDIADYVNDLVSSAKNKAQSTADNVKEYGNNIVDKAKSKYNDLTNQVEGYSDELHEDADNQIAQAKSRVKDAASNANNLVQQA